MASKAEVVELQLKRILEEKKVIDQEIQLLGSEIGKGEDTIKKLKSQLI